MTRTVSAVFIIIFIYSGTLIANPVIVALGKIVGGHLLSKGIDAIWDDATDKPDIRELDQRLSFVEDELRKLDQQLGDAVLALRKEVHEEMSLEDYKARASETIESINYRLTKLEGRVLNNEEAIARLEGRIENLEKTVDATSGRTQRTYSRGDAPIEPMVAVITVGDPLFARDFEQEVENRLLRLGIQLADEHNSLAVSDVLRRGRDNVSVPEMLPSLGEAGIHVLVLIQIEYVGSRQLQYLGRTSEAHQARLRANAYLVYDGGALGMGWSEDVEYTGLNARRKAEAAMFEATNEINEAIRRGWQDYRRRASG